MRVSSTFIFGYGNEKYWNQSVLVVVICYLYIYLDFSYVHYFIAATVIMVNKYYRLTELQSK